MAEENAVTKLLEAYQNAINGKDAKAVIACYTSDVVAYDPFAPPLSQKPDVVRDPHHIQQWFDTWKGPLDSAAEDVSMQVR